MQLRKPIIKMEIIWDFSPTDIQNVQMFIEKNNGPFVKNRRKRNVEKINIIITKDSVIKCLMMCLLTSQQRSGPNSVVGIFLRQNPFPLNSKKLETIPDIKAYTKQILRQNQLPRFIDRISEYFTQNINKLSTNDWSILGELKTLNDNQSKRVERQFADTLSQNLIGFGPKQSRNFLQALGLSKYEIPIDSRITNWLNQSGFPLTLSSVALGDKGYYQFVSDGIQKLCDEAKVYPCILDAAIFSSFDNNEWTEENSIY